MVLACKQYLRECTLRGEDDLLWNKVDTEVHRDDASNSTLASQQLDSTQRAQIQAQLDARLRVSALTFRPYLAIAMYR